MKNTEQISNTVFSPTVSGQSGRHGSGTGERYTSAAVADAFREVIGEDFAIDPFSCSHAQRVIKARRFFSLRERGQNGLELNWALDPDTETHNEGPAFVNSPPRIVREAWEQSLTYHRVTGQPVCWVGFNLGQLSTLQDVQCPLDWPSVILRKREAFDTLALPGDKLTLWRRVKEELPEPKLWTKAEFPDNKERNRVNRLRKVEHTVKQQALVAEWLRRTDLVRVPDDSPSHDNYLTLVTRDPVLIERFARKFATWGALYPLEIRKYLGVTGGLV